MSEIVELDQLNNTELREIVRVTKGIRVGGTNEEIINFIGNKAPPIISNFAATRDKLEKYLVATWTSYSVNMPCNGQPLAGKCTKFGCSDLVHSGCYLGLRDKLEKEGT